MVQESSVTPGTTEVQVKLNALMELASLQGVKLPCQDVKAVLTHVIPAAYRVKKFYVKVIIIMEWMRQTVAELEP